MGRLCETATRGVQRDTSQFLNIFPLPPIAIVIVFSIHAAQYYCNIAFFGAKSDRVTQTFVILANVQISNSRASSSVEIALALDLCYSHRTRFLRSIRAPFSREALLTFCSCCEVVLLFPTKKVKLGRSALSSGLMPRGDLLNEYTCLRPPCMFLVFLLPRRPRSGGSFGARSYFRLESSSYRPLALLFLLSFFLASIRLLGILL